MVKYCITNKKNKKIEIMKKKEKDVRPFIATLLFAIGIMFLIAFMLGKENDKQRREIDRLNEVIKSQSKEEGSNGLKWGMYY